jgi:hypothetical protein
LNRSGNTRLPAGPREIYYTHEIPPFPGRQPDDISVHATAAQRDAENIRSMPLIRAAAATRAADVQRVGSA